MDEDQMTTIPAPYSAYPVEVTPACAPGGGGECDGFGPDGETCGCICHTSGSLPATVAGVARWHELLYLA